MNGEPSQAKSGGFWKSTAGVVAAHAVGLAIVGALLIYVLPQFELILAEQGVGLPDLMQRIIVASHFARDYVFLLLPAAALLLAGDGMLYHRLRRAGREGAAATLRSGLLLLACIAVLLLVIGLYETLRAWGAGVQTVDGP